MALNLHQWKVDETVKNLASKFPRPSAPPIAALSGANTFVLCDVCVVSQHPSAFSFLSCRHYFCKGCWELHFECQILQGISTSKMNIRKKIVTIDDFTKKNTKLKMIEFFFKFREIVTLLDLMKKNSEF